MFFGYCEFVKNIAYSAPSPKANIGSWQVRGMIRTNHCLNYNYLPTATNQNTFDIFAVQNQTNSYVAGLYRVVNKAWVLQLQIPYTNASLNINYVPLTYTNTRMMMTSYSNRANAEFILATKTNYMFNLIYRATNRRYPVLSGAWSNELGISNTYGTGYYDVKYDVNFGAVSNIMMSLIIGDSGNLTNGWKVSTMVDRTFVTNQSHIHMDFVDHQYITNNQWIIIWAKQSAAGVLAATIKGARIEIKKNYK